jgi:hypothetical protein
MTKNIGSYFQVLDHNELSDGTHILHVNELPPPYEITQTQEQSIENDWTEKFIEIKPLHDNLNRYGFNISGGIDTDIDPAIIITHIDSPSNVSFDNGRTNLCLFDRILSVNGISLTHVTHDAAVKAFSSSQGQPMSLHIRRLNPRYIEYIDIVIPSEVSNQPLGITISGGLQKNIDDPSLFIADIDPNGVLISIIKNNQLRIGDRLLEIKTNYTSANLRWVTHSMGCKLFRRICQDNKRVTIVVAHRTLN